MAHDRREGRKGSLADVLVRQKIISEEQRQKVVELGLLGDEPLARLVLELRWATTAQLAEALALQAGCKYVPPHKLRPELHRALRFPPGKLKELGAVPVAGVDPNTFAVARPGHVLQLEELSCFVGAPVAVVVTDENAIPDLLVSAQFGPDGPPGARSGRDRRRATRFGLKTTYRCFYSFFNQQGMDLYHQVFEGELQDLSEGGACIQGTLPRRGRETMCRPETIFKCNLVISGGETIRTSGQVRWMDPSPAPRLQFGVSWQPVFAEDHVLLQKLLGDVSRQWEDVSTQGEEDDLLPESLLDTF
jgi:hypothetical protein